MMQKPLKNETANLLLTTHTCIEKDILKAMNELENSGELAIGEITVGKDLLNISKEIVGASGKKVDILQSENLDVIVEVIR